MRVWVIYVYSLIIKNSCLNLNVHDWDQNIWMPKFADAGVFVWELEVAWGTNRAVSHPWQTMTAADTQWFFRGKSLQTLTELWPSQQQHLCPCEDGFMHWGKTALADALSFSSLLSYFIKLAVSKLTRLPVSCGGVMLWYEPQELFKESSKYVCVSEMHFSGFCFYKYVLHPLQGLWIVCHVTTA